MNIATRLIIAVFILSAVLTSCNIKKEEGSIYGETENDVDNTVVYDQDRIFHDKDSTEDSNIVNPDDSDNSDGDFVPDEDFDIVIPETCGNGEIDEGEVCEKGTETDCVNINQTDYTDGKAVCSENCLSWNTDDCTKLPCSESEDDPDDKFVDTNCDGIDGNIEESVFVDAVVGSDLNSGKIDSPVFSIMKALEIANQNNKKHILVGKGTYNGIIELKDGISIHGSYSGMPDWIRHESNEVIVLGDKVAVKGAGLKNVKISHLKIIAQSNFDISGTSYGINLSNCESIFLNNLLIESGHGGDGFLGSSGLVGQNGEKGNSGESGCETGGGLFCSDCARPNSGSGGESSCGMKGGDGGRPGKGGSNGDSGQNGQGSLDNGGSGGIAGSDGSCTYSNIETAVHGKPGVDGEKGENGEGGKSFGLYDENGYVVSRGSAGLPGLNGQGGGGGGGGKGASGAFCDHYGSSGGGGGGGGCGGGGGDGGEGGGGSVGIWSNNCKDLIIRGVKIITSDGGKGGSGGDGGVGGIGGNSGEAGSGTSGDSGCGGFGGKGGKGGKGGSGGGGGGGPSIGIVKINSTIDGIMQTVFVIGKGGEGGKSTGNEGAWGKAGNVMEL